MSWLDEFEKVLPLADCYCDTCKDLLFQKCDCGGSLLEIRGMPNVCGNCGGKGFQVCPDCGPDMAPAKLYTYAGSREQARAYVALHAAKLLNVARLAEAVLAHRLIKDALDSSVFVETATPGSLWTLCRKLREGLR